MSDNKKDVVVHIFDLFMIIGSVVAGIFFLHTQIERIDHRTEQRIQALEKRTDELFTILIDIYREEMR